VRSHSARLSVTKLGRTAGVHLRLDVVGTSLTLSLDGRVVGQADDTRIVVGTAGIIGGEGASFDNFSAFAL